ncbi:trypsin-like peptidase domain-containing protein [Ensifer sp. IC4062]|nr:trypsin-like peptidase domain-containing protein [Ensifer sp. IC4062]
MTLKTVPDLRFLAAALGRNLKRRITYIAYKLPPASKFRVFTIPKRSGGTRTIQAPRIALLSLQKSIRLLLEQDYHPRVNVHGFVAGHERSIISNAEQHVLKKWVLNIDLENYFGSIHFGRIAGRLQSKPYCYTPEIAKFVAHIACYPTQTLIDGQIQDSSVLMTGGSLSPLLANIVSDKLDSEIARYCSQLGCTYTRYADDITISSNRNKFPGKIARLTDPEDHRSVVLADTFLDLIESNGFSVNHAKTRLLPRAFAQEVTGLIVNKKVNVPRGFVRQVRSMLHDWETNGYAAAEANHFSKFRPNRGRLDEAKNFQWVVRGKLEFIRSVKGSTDQTFQTLAMKYNRLTSGGKINIPIVETNKIIEEAVWFLVNETNGFSTGTCFATEGGSFITCAHCIGPNMTVYPKSAPKFPVSVQMLRQDRVNDLATLDLSALLPAHAPKGLLKLASKAEVDALKVGDEVQIAGFPGNLNEEAVTISKATITRFSKTVLAGSIPASNNVMVLDGGTFSGMSGGPVLFKGKVVGVVVRGPNDDDPNEKCEAVFSTLILPLV